MKNSTLMLYMAVALAGIATIMFTGCNKNDEQPQPPDNTPVITSFSPPEAAEGATVVITGKNFSADKSKNEVSINGKSAEVTDAKASELSVIVPEEATNGRIIVKVDGKSDTSATDFKVNPTAPAISAISPEKGDVDTEVTITGSRFVNNSKVYFNGIEATTVTFVSQTSLRAKVPSGASNGKIKVTAGSLEALSAADFWIKPTLAGFAPEKQEEGKEITINGTNFSTVAGGNTVTFGSIVATDVTIVAPTQLKVKVPAGLRLEPVWIRVSVQQQEATSTTTFLLLPTITSYTPDHGERGAVVTLNGKNFDLNAEVYFNGSKITYFPWGQSATKIMFRVPATATAGKIVLKQNDTEYEAGNFLVTNLLIQKASSPFNVNRMRNSGVNFVLDNKIYIGWGYNSTDNVLFEDEFVAYDPATDTWVKTIKAPANIPPRTGAAAVAVGGKVYMGVGITTTTNTSHNKWYRVDVPTNTWTQMADFPVATFEPAFGVVGNKILVGPGAFTTKIYEFNEAGTGSWSEKADIGLEMYYCSTFELNDRLYFGMALVSGSDFKKSYYGINATGNIITTTEFPGYNETGAATFTYNGKAYLIESSLRQLYEYTPDAAGGTWSKVLSDLPFSLRSAQTVNNKVYLFDAFENAYEYIPNY